ncbi:hypothetical protein P7E02_15190 [Enterococcus hulanensis]|uniref:hypothetical protein n=1 Tax=Enterococcus hulanensis TaxID=2559929 RepID=UPI00288E5D71|nr:hypothetical protein [Enterococcus hulanensis]MDT2661218.1 hypothetical protein [Enterococcus hulanensis]
MEFTEKDYIDSVRYIPNTVENTVNSISIIKNHSLMIDFEIPEFNDHHYGYWWSPDHTNLYDVELVLFVNEQVVDRVISYFGMRTVSIEHQLTCSQYMTILVTRSL